ncbi:MAG: tetratricopeptide repeat protein, partial [Planctomycetes bacterium]|nr:tetratricopeptide repeat protein [Planctomycetota bacterium]
IVKAGHARVLGGIGRSQEAEPMLREVLASLRESRDKSSHEEAAVRTSLGSVLLEKREFAEAREHYEYAIPLIDATYGEGHYTSIPARRGLGLALQGLGQFDEAGAIFAELCTLAAEKLGEDDPETVSARNTYAVFLFHRDRLEEALAQFTTLRATAVRVYGPSHPQTVRIASNQALCHERLENYPEAEGIYREVLAARAIAGARVELSDLITRFNLVVALHRQPDDDKIREALAVSDELLAAADTLLAADSWRLAVFHQHRGIVLRKLGRFEDAEAELATARGTLEAKLGPDDGRTRSNWKEMVELYEAWGRPASALPWQAKLALH